MGRSLRYDWGQDYNWDSGGRAIAELGVYGDKLHSKSMLVINLCLMDLTFPV
jgi:hypothetical protein